MLYIVAKPLRITKVFILRSITEDSVSSLKFRFFFNPIMLKSVSFQQLFQSQKQYPVWRSAAAMLSEPSR